MTQSIQNNGIVAEGNPINNGIEQFGLNPESVPSHLSRYISQEFWDTLTYEQKAILSDIDKLPNQLMGIVPEKVWSTLSLEHKIDFLISNGIIPEGSISEVTSSEGVIEKDTFSNLSTSGGEEVSNISDRVEEFTSFSSEIENIERSHMEAMSELEKQPSQPVKLSGEDQKRVNAERGQTFNTPQPKLTGYAAGDDINSNINAYISGPASLGASWIAHILQKLRSKVSVE